MSVLNLTAQEINRIVPGKLNLRNIRGTKERHGDFYLDNKYQFRVTMPNVHGGSGSLSSGMLKVCRKSVRLSADDFARLVKCSMKEDEYIKRIKEKIKSREGNSCST